VLVHSWKSIIQLLDNMMIPDDTYECIFVNVFLLQNKLITPTKFNAQVGKKVYFYSNMWVQKVVCPSFIRSTDS